ncbi:MAG: hypothetical protein FRX49_01802 [Trebouxia sp. A1-2]|nr:MAG: hypothetical protein FRX49_01802 [Trebouxia sp. A1-2]
MRGVDLTPTDETVALLLLAAHQRNMRKRHIKCKLAGKSCCKGPPDLCKPGSGHLSVAMTQPDKQQPHHYPQEEGHTHQQQDLQLQATDNTRQLQKAEVQVNINQGDRQPQSQPCLSSSSAIDSCHHDMSGSLALTPQVAEPFQNAASQPQNGSAQFQQHNILLQQQPTSHHAHDDSACEHSQHAQQQVQQQHQHLQSGFQQAEVASSNGGSISGKKQNPRKQKPTLQQMHLPTGVDPEQGWGRGADTDDDDSDVSYDDGDVAVFEEGRGCGFPCVLTPSSMAAADLAPHLNHHQAANIYLGDRDAVDDETLHTASKFAKYAIAAYGQFGLDYKDETGHHGASWKLAMGKRFHSYKKNKLVRSKVKTHKQRLHYEAIIQVAQIQDEDLLYLNFTNAAMGDVPYIICLDRPTRSVVLSIRGTQSLADGATDLLAYPHPLHHWLPDCYREKEEAMYGHAGMLGAAAAVWEDLRTNHLLAALLDLPADEDCKPHHQDRGEQKYDPRMSHSEKERHMAWESGDACLSDEASAEGSPAKDAAIAGKHRSQGRSRKMESHGRHGHADRSPAAFAAAQRPHQCNQQTGETNGTGFENSHNGQHKEQKGKLEDDEQECGLSLDGLGHENVGSQQALRNEDQQNKFVAGIIRRGLYKEGWKLVITGHSLGAGVAALLSLKMHQRAQGVKCWAFCPPGGLLSQNLSHAAEDYCTSIIVNKDMVPRLSLKTVYRLFEGKMIALARCNKTATRVLLHALRAGSRRVLLSDPRLFRPWSQVSSEAKDMLHRFQERPAEDSITTLGLEIGLYPPGRQIFLRRFKKESQPKRAEDVTWDAVWIQPEEIIGEGILAVQT